MQPDDTRTRIARYLPDLVALGRDIHAHPELGMEQTRSAALFNHARETDAMAAAARALVGEAAVDDDTTPVTGGEDFAFMLRAKPGAFVFLGAGAAPDGQVHGLHTPLHDFNDAALPHGVAFWVELVGRELGHGEGG